MPPSFQAPPGTRDFYPADLLARRYVEKLWRDTALRHGFEEIDGPTFEHADLYAVKSGEGILSELFQAFSGKDPGQAALAGQGRAPYALRPEFTPTLARLYAARAGSLPKPCRWFWQQNCFRAERQQRGRLREFMQWNCDVIGGEGSESVPGDAGALALSIEAEAILACIGLLELSGLSPELVRVHVSHAGVARTLYHDLVPPLQRQANLSLPPYEAFTALLDRRSKLSEADLLREGVQAGFAEETIRSVLKYLRADNPHDDRMLSERGTIPTGDVVGLARGFNACTRAVFDASLAGWLKLDYTIVRGLAYYTGTVFEVHEASGAERALAGGGRYDHLIELFGGPPTPAVGFGMGDVVLSNVLRDRGLLPEGEHLLDALSAPGASYRPDAFVVSNGLPDADAMVRPLLSALRRGTPSPAWLAREGRKPWDADRFAPSKGGVPPLHARTTGKATKNVGKLIQDARAQRSRFAVIVESGEEATLQDLSRQDAPRERVPLRDAPSILAGRLGAR